jgi:hypothetical protein
VTRSAKSLEPIIKQLYQARNELRALFPELPFTLDGRLVGDIGEAIALQEFGLAPLPSCSELHDFLASDGRKVQIKTTQGTISGQSVGLGLTKQSFEHLIVIQISEEGRYHVLNDGPGSYIDDARQHKKTASLTIGQLQRLNEKVKNEERVIKSA